MNSQHVSSNIQIYIVHIQGQLLALVFLDNRLQYSTVRASSSKRQLASLVSIGALVAQQKYTQVSDSDTRAPAENRETEA